MDVEVGDDLVRREVVGHSETVERCEAEVLREVVGDARPWSDTRPRRAGTAFSWDNARSGGLREAVRRRRLKCGTWPGCRGITERRRTVRDGRREDVRRREDVWYCETGMRREASVLREAAGDVRPPGVANTREAGAAST